MTNPKMFDRKVQAPEGIVIAAESASGVAFTQTTVPGVGITQGYVVAANG